MNTIDKLGNIKAQIADLQKEARIIEDRLKAKGPGEYEGDLFEATVCTVDTDRVDWKAVAKRLHPSRQLVTANTTHNHTYRLTLKARS
jgi:hypothetical protein